VHNGDKLIAGLKPAIASYRPGGKTVREIDVRRTLAGDLYLAMTEFDRTQNLINLQVLIKPLINWIWIGSFVMVFGTLGVLLSPYRRKATVPEYPGKDGQ
jgi:cytochrome c-type biogenesis protein CcmF